MRLVPNFTPPYFQAKNVTLQFHLVSTVLVIKTKKMSENGEIYTADKKITLPLAVAAWTNLTSGKGIITTVILSITTTHLTIDNLMSVDKDDIVGKQGNSFKT